MKTYISILISCILFCACQKSQIDFGPHDLNYANRQLLEVSMEDGFSPPVASRVLVYPHIAHYISLNLFYADSLTPIQNKLQGLNFTSPQISTDANPNLTALLSFSLTAKKLVFNEKYMENLFLHFKTKATENGISQSSIEASEKLAINISDQILQWAATDNYAVTRTLDRYTSIKEPGKWIETPPDYTPGLEPHWMKIRTLILDSPRVYIGKLAPEFNTDKDSEFFDMVMEVYNKSKTITEEEKETAMYWDDNPNTSSHRGHLTIITHKISPPGHWTNIISQVSRENTLSMFQTSKIYTYACIAMFDGIISCWEEKYRTNLVRPITYIQENIETDWECIIQTPPFPEYTSGHSVVSAAAAEMLTQCIGDNIAFTDSTEILFDQQPRTFSSFHEAAWEVSLSRFYGGIHYMISVEEGNKQGRFIAQYILQHIEK